MHHQLDDSDDKETVCYSDLRNSCGPRGHNVLAMLPVSPRFAHIIAVQALTFVDGNFMIGE